VKKRKKIILGGLVLAIIVGVFAGGALAISSFASIESGGSLFFGGKEPSEPLTLLILGVALIGLANFFGNWRFK
jgi:uncharacterized integral membrane protein